VFHFSYMMDPAILGLLPVSMANGSTIPIPVSWSEDALTQGNELPPLVIVSMLEKEPIKLSDTLAAAVPEPEAETAEAEGHTSMPNNCDVPGQARRKERTVGITAASKDTVPFLDMLADMIDPLFNMYLYENKRAIRQHLKTRLIDWVSQNARAFFGPMTSRSISACIRGHNITLADMERFGELVSFFMDAAVLVGTKIVVWHGYGSTDRKPVCSLVMKQQGVFVSGYKKMTQ
jgi:hypothetical protein